MRIQLRYLPIADAQEGMTLGAPVVLGSHGVSNFTLATGHVLTDSNIHQMAVRNAEFICVQEEDTRSDEERAAEWAVEEMRLEHIFRGANSASPAMARLRDAIYAYRRG